MNKAERILAISKRLGLTHIGSCLSVLPVLEEIYQEKKPQDKVLLSNGHAHLAHLLFTSPDKAEELIEKDIHCNREAGCDFSGGSLGHAVGAGIGMALANRERKVFVVVSDGSQMEGSEMESLRIKTDLKLDNLIVYANLNGFTALEEIDRDKLSNRLRILCPDIRIRYTDNGEGLNGVKGHYQKI